MQLTRRQAVSASLAGAVFAAIPLRVSSAIGDLIAEFTDGTPTSMGDLVLIAPEIAENGSSVAIEVSCPGAEAIRFLAPANPNPEVCTVRFGPLAGEHHASLRIRMAESQEIIALARMPDGSFREARAQVYVTVGGCVA